mmetsp:Transcript_17177/g.37346  ORF Transcript_17177/g.37346 Transcript_17177/m.37346 type:complete len:291 (+) Transcript_17177:589-1461(+)
METNEDVVAIMDVPEFLMIEILSYLSAADLVRFGTTCKSLQLLAQLDELWKPLVVRNNWAELGAAPGEQQDLSWMSRYSAEMSIRCLDCFRRTKYVFQPLNRRLCAECERSSYTYRLVTAEQAAEELDLRISPVQLASTRSIEKGGFTFFLQSDLLKLTKRCHGTSKAAVAESSDEEEVEEEVEHSLPARNKASSSSKQAALKEQRKQNKKATKLLQRAKRQGLDTSLVLPSRVALDTSSKRPPVFAKKNRSKSECVNAPRQQSPWEKQRELLEAEFGQFGISGLVLKTT